MGVDLIISSMVVLTAISMFISVFAISGSRALEKATTDAVVFSTPA